jgi:hypothetical protein
MIGVGLRLGKPFEREQWKARTEDEDVEADAEGPKVGGAQREGPATAHLGREECRRAHRAQRHVRGSAQLRGAKVTDAHAAVRAQQQVVRLYVAVRHTHAVQKIHSLQTDGQIGSLLISSFLLA